MRTTRTMKLRTKFESFLHHDFEEIFVNTKAQIAAQNIFKTIDLQYKMKYSPQMKCCLLILLALQDPSVMKKNQNQPFVWTSS